MKDLYSVVHHHQYEPGYRVYHNDDPYLKEYASMYTLILESLSLQYAQEICAEMNDEEIAQKNLFYAKLAEEDEWKRNGEALG